MITIILIAAIVAIQAILVVELICLTRARPAPKASRALPAASAQVEKESAPGPAAGS